MGSIIPDDGLVFTLDFVSSRAVRDAFDNMSDVQFLNYLARFHSEEDENSYICFRLRAVANFMETLLTHDPAALLGANPDPENWTVSEKVAEKNRRRGDRGHLSLVAEGPSPAAIAEAIHETEEG